MQPSLISVSRDEMYQQLLTDVRKAKEQYHLAETVLCEADARWSKAIEDLVAFEKSLAAEAGR